MRIMDFLLGKKKYFETKKLGIFKARVRNENSVRGIVWSNSIDIPHYKKKVIILLEGNVNEPLKNQVETATWITENIKTLDEEIISKIKNNSDLSEKFKNKKITDLRLDMIYPSVEELYKFELSYVSISDNEFSITVLLDNKKIVDIQ